MLSGLLAQLGLPVGIAELHGGLCAALCTGGVDGAGRWMAESSREWESGVEADRIRSPLEQLQLQTWQALAGSDMRFTPLLPDDDDDLAERVQALALWCHGFVSAIGLAGPDFSAHEAAAEIEELIRDFAQISRAGLGADELEDERLAEFTFVELVEYVRVGVQYVYEELSASRELGGRDTIH